MVMANRERSDLSPPRPWQRYLLPPYSKYLMTLLVVLVATVSWFGFSPDGRKLASMDGSTLQKWVETVRQEFQDPQRKQPRGVTEMFMSPDGKIVYSQSRSEAYLWNMRTGTWFGSFPVAEGSGGDPCFSSDSKLIANADSTGSVHVWNVETQKEIKQFAPDEDMGPSHLDGMNCHFSADMKTMAALGLPGGMDQPVPVLIWDAETGELLTRRKLPIHTLGCFSSDNKLLALILTEFHPNLGENEVEEGKFTGPRTRTTVTHHLSVQDADSGRTLFKLSSVIFQLAFSPDGKTLMGRRQKLGNHAPSIYEICVWEVATGKERMSFATEGNSPFSASNDRRRIAELSSAGLLHECHVYDSVTGREIYFKTPGGGLNGFSCTAISPDGMTLLTGMDDGTIRKHTLPPKKDTAIRGSEYGPQELSNLWTDLAGPDAGKAHVAIWRLIAMPSKSVPFLTEHLQPASDDVAKTVQRCIADLDNSSFATREAAQKELVRLYFDAAPALQVALDKKPSLEVRHRLETILGSAWQDQPSETLAQLRAIEILEYIGNPAARQSLEILAQGAPGARLTQEAMASLERLSRSPRSN
jgi:WD40 repeat protein